MYTLRILVNCIYYTNDQDSGLVALQMIKIYNKFRYH